MKRRKFSMGELYQATKNTILKYGYEGFTFTLLAEQLNVARGTIYRYFKNKEELITRYMLYEMDQFLNDLKQIDTYRDFDSQFEYLLNIILNRNKIHQILSLAHHIPPTTATVKKNIEQLDQLHQEMYTILEQFVRLGREEKRLKPGIANEIILGFIFQSVNIPKHAGVEQDQWIESIKEIIKYGMFTR